MTTLSQTDSLSSGQRWLRALTEKLSGQNLAETFRQLLLPAIGIALFLGFWHLAAPQVQTSLGAFPGPADVLEQSGQLWQEHSNQRDRAAQFVTMQEERNERILAETQTRR